MYHSFNATSDITSCGVLPPICFNVTNQGLEHIDPSVRCNDRLVPHQGLVSDGYCRGHVP